MRVGVMIIGALLWDTHPTRISWRGSRLSLDRSQHVRASIGYRRRSQSWQNAFTMTFSSDGAPGQAVLVPCRAEAVDVIGLLQEARELWCAERRSATAGPLGSTWGCVGAAFRTEVTSDPMLMSWVERFRQEVATPVPPVGDGGLLAIPWPLRIDDREPADCDVILATATEQTPSTPSPEVVADAWLEQTGGAEKYFFENVRHGIRTAEDLAIWQRVEAIGAHWLNDSRYAEPIAILRREAGLASNQRVEPTASNFCGRIRAMFRRGSRADR